MTCIVGLVTEDGTVWMGGDSAGVAGWSLEVRADHKVFARDGFAFGFTTSFRMGQLINYALTIPERHADEDLHAWMATTFVGALRECLFTGGFSRRKDEVETGGTFLVGHAGRLFTVGDSFQVGESVHGFTATGCGQDVALGYLWERAGKPEMLVRGALGAAEQFSAGVRGPFHVVKT